jgi:hypothetical protein
LADRDRGAALVVAIGFMVMIGAMAAGLTSMVTSGVGNRIALDEIRDRQYAADGAVEIEVAAMRSAVGAASARCGDARTSEHTINGVTVRVDARLSCVAVAAGDGLPVRQYVGAFDACEDEGRPCTDADVVVRALVGFETDAAGSNVTTSVRGWSVLG